MSFIPTTKVDLEAPTVTQDAYGDDVDAWTAVEEALPAAYAQRRKRVWDPVERRAETVVWGEFLLPSRLEVAEGHRLRDQTSGLTHHVRHVHRPQNIVAPGAFLRVEVTAPEA